MLGLRLRHIDLSGPDGYRLGAEQFELDILRILLGCVRLFGFERAIDLGKRQSFAVLVAKQPAEGDAGETKQDGGQSWVLFDGMADPRCERSSHAEQHGRCAAKNQKVCLTWRCQIPCHGQLILA